MRGNGPYLETQLFEDALTQLHKLLPPNWGLDLDRASHAMDYGFDATLTVAPPNAAPTRILVEAKLSTRGHVRQVIERLRYVARDDPALVLTDFANPALRRGCREAGLGYLDLTGWAYLATDTGLLVNTQGSRRSPAPPPERSTAMSRLDGPGASAVIRALWEAFLPVGVRDLAIRAAVSPGTVAKVLPSLVSYGAVDRDERGAVIGLDRRLLIERWTEDYGIYSTNPEVHWLLDPRGINHAYGYLSGIADGPEARPEGIALTGDFAALNYLSQSQSQRSVHGVIPPTLLAVYSGDPRLLIDDVGFKKATPATANVVVVLPRDETLLSSELRSVPLAQVMADLLTMGSRFPELADQVIETIGPAGYPI